MSGHSKWHNIQKTKGAADAKRSAAFTKIAKEIIVAVKQGGSGDPNNNSRLATVIAKAKAANMPNDNIKRTIDKALGSGNTDNYESVTYEGYGPGGVAVIVEALTDNRQRTAPEVRHYFDKYGKGMGAQGCVSWSFDRKGVIIIDNEDGGVGLFADCQRSDGAHRNTRGPDEDQTVILREMLLAPVSQRRRKRYHIRALGRCFRSRKPFRTRIRFRFRGESPFGKNLDIPIRICAF